MIIPRAYSVLSSSVFGAPPRRPQPAAAPITNVTAIRFFMGPLVTRTPGPARTLVFLRHASKPDICDRFRAPLDAGGG